MCRGQNHTTVLSWRIYLLVYEKMAAGGPYTLTVCRVRNGCFPLRQVCNNSAGRNGMKMFGPDFSGSDVEQNLDWVVGGSGVLRKQA